MVISFATRTCAKLATPQVTKPQALVAYCTWEAATQGWLRILPGIADVEALKKILGKYYAAVATAGGAQAPVQSIEKGIARGDGSGSSGTKRSVEAEELVGRRYPKWQKGNYKN